MDEIKIATTLTEPDCNQVKGFFYARPLPEAELDQLLAWKLRGQC